MLEEAEGENEDLSTNTKCHMAEKVLSNTTWKTWPAAGMNHSGHLLSLLSWSPFISFQQVGDREAMKLCFVSHREMQGF